MKVYILKNFVDKDKTLQKDYVYSLREDFANSLIRKGYASSYEGAVTETSKKLKINLVTYDSNFESKVYYKKLRRYFFIWTIIGSAWFVLPFLPLTSLGFDYDNLLGYSLLSPSFVVLSFFLNLFMISQFVFIVTGIYLWFYKRRINHKVLKVYKASCFFSLNFFIPYFINIHNKSLNKKLIQND